MARVDALPTEGLSLRKPRPGSKFLIRLSVCLLATIAVLVATTLRPFSGNETLGSIYTGAFTATSQQTESFDFDLEEFLSTFKAAEPEKTELCKAYLRSPAKFNEQRKSFINYKWWFSQYNQDWFMFVNFFHRMATNNIKGFYVESGANDPIRVSNTALLDYCLGWDGLCVEPSNRYTGKLFKERSCILEKHCLSYKEETIFLGSNEVPSAEKGQSMNCVRLDSLLDKHGIKTVHLWSLDVEGYERKALAGIDLKKYDVQTILMEQQEPDICQQFPIDYRLTTLGYHKYRLVSDAFYVKANYGQTYSTLRFPDGVDALDTYFRELDGPRCKKKGTQLIFFTDPQE